MCWSVVFGCCFNLTWRLKVNTSLKGMVHELRSFCHQTLLFFPYSLGQAPQSPPLSPFLSWDPGEIFLLTRTPVWLTPTFLSVHISMGEVFLFSLFFFIFPLPRKYFSKNDQIFLAAPNTETCCTSNSRKHVAWLWIPFSQEITFQKCVLSMNKVHF